MLDFPEANRTLGRRVARTDLSRKRRKQEDVSENGLGETQKKGQFAGRQFPIPNSPMKEVLQGLGGLQADPLLSKEIGYVQRAHLSVAL